MITRPKLIIGNWKMHLNVHQSSLLVQRLDEHIKTHRTVEVVLAPSMLALQPLSLQIDRRKFRLAAQDIFSVDEGAYTGEVSATMVRDLVHYAIVGHSERRLYFHESLELIRDKVAACIRNEISPVLCIGETKQERYAHETKRVIHDQLVTALSPLTSQEIHQVVIAYEPIWAISTFGGELAKPYQVAEVLQYIREQVAHLYGETVAARMRILYGGSVNDHIVRSYLELSGCDGVLVGGASLNWQAFSGIVATAERLQSEQRKDSA